MIDTKIEKWCQQTTGLIKKLINISHILLIGVLVVEKFNWESVVHNSQAILAWKTISCQSEKGKRVKHRHIQQDNCVDDTVMYPCCFHFASPNSAVRPIIGDMLYTTRGRGCSSTAKKLRALLIFTALSNLHSEQILIVTLDL